MCFGSMSTSKPKYILGESFAYNTYAAQGSEFGNNISVQNIKMNIALKITYVDYDCLP
jgi:hypothetical protein